MVITKKTGMKGIVLVFAYIVCVVLINTLGADVSAQSEIGRGPQNSLSQAQIEPLSIDPLITETGNITLSVDGLGTLSATGTIEVQKPAGATVRAAFLAAATTPTTRILANGDVKINDNDVTWDSIVPGGFMFSNGGRTSNGFADVTTIVKPIVDAAAPGLLPLTITEVNSATLDGEVLAVIFDDPNQTTINTVIILFGAQSSGGDTFIVNTADPINPTNPIDFSLGISFGFQPDLDNPQFSIINVNGVRLTSSAGGQDDGQADDGALLTVGGIGDSNTNPPPFADDSGGPRTDDELYDLRPFVEAADTTVTVNTQNPSNDDNIFFAAFFFKDARAAIEECTLTCPSDITTLNDPGQCGASVNYPPPTPSESCATPTCLPVPGSFFPVGTTTVTCTSENPTNVSTTSCSFTITVRDTQPPTISCPSNITQSTSSSQCSAFVNFASPTATDNCPGVTLTCAPPSGSSFPVGTTSVTCTATDAAGNTTSCGFTVTVNDTQGPTLICPSNITQCSAVVNYTTPTATDNCDGSRPVTCVPPSGSVFSPGTTTVTCSSIDTRGNTGTCGFAVTINDTEAPRIVSCPRDIVQPADANQCSAEVNFPTPGVTDNCTGATIVCIPPSGQRLEAGTSRTVTCTATDAAGNKSECAFQISVRDDQPPTIVCPTTPVEIDARGACTIKVPGVIDRVRNSVSDTCTPVSGLNITQTPAEDATVGSDLRAINVTVSDAAGASRTCQIPVTVINSGGQPAQVTIGSGNQLDLSVNLLTKKKKKKNKKVKPAIATGTFTVKNVQCDRTSLALPFGGVMRVTDTEGGQPINNPNDNQFFSVFIGCGSSRTKLNVGDIVPIAFDETVCFTVEFTPTVPPVGSSTTNLSASQVLPGDFMSDVLLSGISPVRIHARVASEVKLIDPATGSSTNPVVTICQSGDNQFTVRYHVWSPSKADVRSVKYDFLDSSGGTIKSIDVDLAGPLAGTSLVNGQSFNVEQSFTGTGVSSVRVTLNGTGSSSSTATSGPISPSCPSAIQFMMQRRPTLFLPGLTVDAVKP